jgi:hypothetical protein
MEGPDRQAVWNRLWMKTVTERRSMVHSNSQCLQHFHPVCSYRTMSVVPQTHVYWPPKKHSTSPLFSLVLGRLRQLASLLFFSIDYDIDDDCLSSEIWPVMNTTLVQRLVSWACYLVLVFFLSCLTDKCQNQRYAQRSASLTSYVACRKRLTVDDGCQTNVRSDNNLQKV